MSMCGQEGWGEEKVLHELGNETLSVSMAGFHGGRFRRRWGNMEHRPEEPLSESSGDEQDWSNSWQAQHFVSLQRRIRGRRSAL